jgi:hypothetical protein
VARRAARRRLLCVAQAHRPLLRLAQARRRQLHLAQARRRLLRLCRTSGCLGTSRGSSRSSSSRSSSTTPPRAGSLSTTSPLSHDRVPRHVARLVTRLVAPLVIDYFASRRLVVDYFASVVRPGASARRVARHAARRATRRRLLSLSQARRRLLRLRRASWCLGTSRGSSRGTSCGSSSTTSPTPCVWVLRHVARLIACRRLLHLRRATGCLSSSRGAWLVAPLVVDYSVSRRLVVDYFTSAARPGTSARRAAHRLSSTASPTPIDRLPRLITRLIAWLVAPLVVDYF